ncbi:MAG: roadblock/LC7 domain-containing protein [Gemmatimonadaceae bacterium]|nr:roadblock/LC7 domain-containing protein [Gemmatimonadaceae bacterium]
MPAADDIRRWSSVLATDPQSLVFADLAEALRQQGDLETAERLATRGLERHPSHAPALMVLARIAEARGDLSAASAHWDRARQHEPAPAHGHGNGGAPPTPDRYSGADGNGAAASNGPNGGMPNGHRFTPRVNTRVEPGRIPNGRTTGAAYPTASYPAISGFSATIASAPARPEVVRSLVADADGLLLASPQPSDDMAVLEAMAAAVAGVGDDAARAMKHLNLGAWHALVLETAGDTLALAPAPAGSLTVLSVGRQVPIGRVRALLRVATARAAADGF